MTQSGHVPGIDLDQARQIVLDTYGKVDTSDLSVAERMYPREALEKVPTAVKALALGVGHPVGFADLQPGEVVLDLGSGGGIDTLLAAKAVGPEGKAIGLDVTPEMVTKAREYARQAGASNVEYLEGSMEKIPLPDESIVVIISNGGVSMSSQKHRVFWETWRVLKPGGRMVFGDMAQNGPLPAEIRKHPEAIAT